MIDSRQLKIHVTIPTLKRINLCSDAAVNLLLGTAAQETLMGYYLKQIRGPALGPYGMQPETHDDIWRNFLVYNPTLAQRVRQLHNDVLQAQDLIGNLWYATAMCRVHYFRVPEPLPNANDIEALAKYWKNWYNTKLGKGSEAQFVENYHRFVLGENSDQL